MSIAAIDAKRRSPSPSLFPSTRFETCISIGACVCVCVCVQNLVPGHAEEEEDDDEVEDVDDVEEED